MRRSQGCRAVSDVWAAPCARPRRPQTPPRPHPTSSHWQTAAPPSAGPQPAKINRHNSPPCRLSAAGRRETEAVTYGCRWFEAILPSLVVLVKRFEFLLVGDAVSKTFTSRTAGPGRSLVIVSEPVIESILGVLLNTITMMVINTISDSHSARRSRGSSEPAERDVRCRLGSTGILWQSYWQPVTAPLLFSSLL